LKDTFYSELKNKIIIIVCLFIILFCSLLLIVCILPPLTEEESRRLANESYRDVENRINENEFVESANIIDDYGDFGPHLVIDINLTDGGRIVLDNVNWTLKGRNAAIWCVGEYAVEGDYYWKWKFFYRGYPTYECLRYDALSKLMGKKINTIDDIISNYAEILVFLEDTERKLELTGEECFLVETPSYEACLRIDKINNKKIQHLGEIWQQWHPKEK